MFLMWWMIDWDSNRWNNELRPSGWQGGALLRTPSKKIYCTQPKWQCCYIFRSLLTFVPRLHTSPTLLWGNDWTQQWHWSQSAPAQCGSSPMFALRLCIGLARTYSELYPVSDSSYLMLLHSHSPFKGIRTASPTTPAPSIVILHNHSPQ